MKTDKLIALLFSLISVTVAVVFSRTRSNFEITLFFWLLAQLAVIAACPRAAIRAGKRSFEINSGVVLAALTLALAAALRLSYLDQFPIQLHNDEMNCGLEARRFFADLKPLLFGTGWSGHPNLQFYIINLFLRVFGDTLFGLRMSAVVFGLGALVAVYLLAKELFNERVALIALVLTSAFHLHLHYSRSGFHYMMASFFAAWGGYVLIRAWRAHSFRMAALAGIIFAWGVQTYPSAMIGPLTLGAWCVFQLFSDRQEATKRARILLVTIFAGTVTLAPLLYGFWLNPAVAGERARGISVFAPNMRAHVAQSVGSERPLDIAIYQLKRSIGYLAFEEEQHAQYGGQYMSQDWVTFVLFWIGVLLMLRRFKEDGPRFVLLWMGLGVLLGGAINVDPPSSPRLLILTVTWMMVPAFAIDALLNLCQANMRGMKLSLSHALVVALVLFAATTNIYRYMLVYPHQKPGTLIDRVTRMLHANPEIREVYVDWYDTVNFSYESFGFMAPNVKASMVTNDPEAMTTSLKRGSAPALLITREDISTKLKLDGIAVSQAGQGLAGRSSKGEDTPYYWYYSESR